MRSVVVLPAPLWPMKPNTSPLGTSNVRSMTARVSPNDFERLRISIAVSPGIGIQRSTRSNSPVEPWTGARVVQRQRATPTGGAFLVRQCLASLPANRRS